MKTKALTITPIEMSKEEKEDLDRQDEAIKKLLGLQRRKYNSSLSHFYNFHVINMNVLKNKGEINGSIIQR